MGRTVEFCALAVPESHNLLKTSSNFSKINYEFASIAKDSAKNKKLSYICGLRARIECEHGSEHSTHSDRVTNIGYCLFRGAVFGCRSKIRINLKGFGDSPIDCAFP